MSFDLTAYFARIGYTGSVTVDVRTLSALHERHVLTIPFENIDVLLGKGIELDIDSIQRKLVLQKRGGYCFEQNLLYAEAIRALGFNPIPMLARVHWMNDLGSQSPRTHLVHAVLVDGVTWLTDVGFGGAGVLQPMRLNPLQDFADGSPPRRLHFDGKRFLQQIWINGEWAVLYSFTEDPVMASDLVVANWYTSTHPHSHFRHRLIAAIAREDARLTLSNNQLTIRRLDGSCEKLELQGQAAVLEVLRDTFGIELPPETHFTQLQLAGVY